MKDTSEKRPLASVRGRNIVPNDTVTIRAKDFGNVYKGRATKASSIKLTNWPIKGADVTFEKGNTHWKISVTFSAHRSCAEVNEIWNAALRLACKNMGRMAVKAEDGRCVQRLTVPLSRDGDAALQYVKRVAMPVFYAAQLVLRIAWAGQPQMQSEPHLTLAHLQEQQRRRSSVSSRRLEQVSNRKQRTASSSKARPTSRTK